MTENELTSIFYQILDKCGLPDSELAHPDLLENICVESKKFENLSMQIAFAISSILKEKPFENHNGFCALTYLYVATRKASALNWFFPKEPGKFFDSIFRKIEKESLTLEEIVKLLFNPKISKLLRKLVVVGN